MTGSQETAKVAFITMGCAKNEVDSAHMAARLAAGGYDVIVDAAEADVVIVNTCSFIQAATEESIEAILDAAELPNVASGGARLVVAGCMPARYGAELEAELPEVDRFVGCDGEAGIAGVLDEMLGRARPGSSGQPAVEPGSAAATGDVSAYVKISDGCDRFCSYCAIPLIRGRYHSFSESEIAAEVAGLVARGVREVVLIAQDTGRWGEDLEGASTLAGLVSRLAESHPQTWFRIMYIQPEGVTDELIEAVASHENVCSYFDIPFQHCERDVLSRMNRSGSGDDYLALATKVRERVEGAVLRTTLIAGFPGETEEQFEALCDFVERAELDYVGVFPYSPEEGTRAAKLDGQIDEDERLARAQRLRDVADAVSSAVVSARVGRELDVLVCGTEEDGQLFGRTMGQAPDVDGVTFLDAGAGELGEVVRAHVVGTLLYEMEAEVVR